MKNTNNSNVDNIDNNNSFENSFGEFGGLNIPSSTAREIIEKVKDIPPQQSISFLFERFLNTILKEERSIHLSEDNNNKGNGFYERSVNDGINKLNLNIPRLRSGSFNSQFLPESYKRVYSQSYEDLLNSFLVSGYSKSSILNNLKFLGLPYSEQEVERLADSLYAESNSFKKRSLDNNIFAVFVDGYRCQVKDEDGKIKLCTIYVIISVDIEGNKDLIGYYPIFGRENTVTWRGIFLDLMNRGLKKLSLVISDDFAGIKEVIKSLFKESDHQLCYVHMQRNITRNLNKKDSKKFNKKLKEIRELDQDKDTAIKDFENLCEEYKDTYQTYMELLISKKYHYFAFKKYEHDMQKYLYTTNCVENFNSLIERKRRISGGHFQSQKFLEINLYLIQKNLKNKAWKNVVPNIAKFRYQMRQDLAARYDMETHDLG